jgi:hypothetical protein
MTRRSLPQDVTRPVPSLLHMELWRGRDSGHL